MTPEETARQQIDTMLKASGWTVQTKDKINHCAARGVAEQTRIVAEVKRQLSVVEELEAVVSAKLQRASHLRQSILQQTFNGKLTHH